MKTFRSLIAAAAIALTATVAVGAPSAGAATSVTACFRWYNNTAFANQTMELWRSDSAGNLISLVKSGKSAANGCGTFYSTPSNIYMRVIAVYNTPKVGPHFDHYQGWSPYLAPTGAGATNLGTGYVYWAWYI